MAPVVPLKAHDAAAGAQVCRLLAAPRLAEGGKSASEPNRWTAEQYTSVLLYKISVECSIRPAEILRQNIVSRKMKKLCKKEKQQTRLAGLLLLMRYSRAIC